MLEEIAQHTSLGRMRRLGLFFDGFVRSFCSLGEGDIYLGNFDIKAINYPRNKTQEKEYHHNLDRSRVGTEHLLESSEEWP